MPWARAVFWVWIAKWWTSSFPPPHNNLCNYVLLGHSKQTNYYEHTQCPGWPEWNHHSRLLFYYSGMLNTSFNTRQQMGAAAVFTLLLKYSNYMCDVPRKPYQADSELGVNLVQLHLHAPRYKKMPGSSATWSDVLSRCLSMKKSKEENRLFQICSLCVDSFICSQTNFFPLLLLMSTWEFDLALWNDCHSLLEC